MPPKKAISKPASTPSVTFHPISIQTDSYSKTTNYKILCLNTNGIRAALKKGLIPYIKSQNPDIFCISETKVGAKKISDFLKEAVPVYPELFDYNYIFSSATNKEGYAGTAIFMKKSIEIVSHETNFPNLAADSLINLEGRYINIETQHFHLISVYVPNSGRGGGVSFLPERMDYEDEIRFVLKQKRSEKPVIYCGDLNVVTAEIDIFNFKSNFGSPGVTKEEMSAIKKLKKELEVVDSFREIHGDKVKFSWFSNFGNARKNKEGWRIDYFLVDKKIQDAIVKADIDDDCQYLSDHVPITLELDFKK